MPGKSRTWSGSCHRGKVGFEIGTEFADLTTCNCSICSRRNAFMVKVHESGFRLLRGEAVLVEYRFRSRTARHFFCGVCGIYPFHRTTMNPDYVGINVFCLEGFNPKGVPVRATSGGGME